MTTFDGIMIWVPDVRASTEFWAKAFDVEARWVRDEGDYAQLETGATTLQFADEAAAPGSGVRVAPNRPDGPAAGVQVSLAVDDVPAAFDRAVGAGAAAVAEPVTKPWGQAVAYVRDLNGLLVELSSAMD